MRAYQNHALQFGTRRVGLQRQLTFECLCGRVLAQKTADALTHVEFLEVLRDGLVAVLADTQEPRRWIHQELAHGTCPEALGDLIRARRSFAPPDEMVLAAEGLSKGTELLLPGGRLADGPGTTPTVCNASAATNPS